MSRHTDPWGLDGAIPFALIVGGLMLIPFLWPIGAAALTIGVVMTMKSMK